MSRTSPEPGARLPHPVSAHMPEGRAASRGLQSAAPISCDDGRALGALGPPFAQQYHAARATPGRVSVLAAAGVQPACISTPTVPHTHPTPAPCLRCRVSSPHPTPAAAAPAAGLASPTTICFPAHRLPTTIQQDTVPTPSHVPQHKVRAALAGCWLLSLVPRRFCAPPLSTRALTVFRGPAEG